MEKDFGKRIKRILLDIGMKVSTRMIGSMDMVSFIGSRVMYTRVIIKMMSVMVMVKCTSLMVLFTRVTGLVDCRMERALL